VHKEQKIKVAEDAEGATRPYDENDVKLANIIVKAKDIVASWDPRPDQADGGPSTSFRKDLTMTSSASTTASSTSSAMRQ
jgi:hypothetical protein